MKDNFRAFFIAGLFFGIIIGLYIGLTKNLSLGLSAGILGGILFGFVTFIFVSIQSKKFKRNGPKIVGDKIITYEGGANHLKGSEYVGGWLYMTEDELIFKSHNINLQNHTLVIPLNQITDVSKRSTLGLVPNGLEVKANGKEEKFVVYRRKVWIHKINETIAVKNHKGDSKY